MKYDYVSERTSPESIIRTPQDIMPILDKFSRKKQEHFLVLTLAGNHVAKRLAIVSIGLANRTLVHPREVFVPAIKDHAVAIMVVTGNIPLFKITFLLLETHPDNCSMVGQV